MCVGVCANGKYGLMAGLYFCASLKLSTVEWRVNDKNNNMSDIYSFSCSARNTGNWILFFCHCHRLRSFSTSLLSLYLVSISTKFFSSAQEFNEKWI